MKFYFSGVESVSEQEQLVQAGVSHIIVDPSQYRKLNGNGQRFNVALDSGAYRTWKAKGESSLVVYMMTVEDYVKEGMTFDFITGLDDMDNWEGTRRNFLDWGVMCDIPVVPVWHYGEPIDLLEEYLGLTWEVGVGGLVPYLYTDAEKEPKEECRQVVSGLCAAYPHRLRLFGACDVPLLNAVIETALSADSSVWLRGQRRGAYIYINERSGKLQQVDKWLMKRLARDYPEIEQALQMSGPERSIANARNIERYVSA